MSKKGKKEPPGFHTPFAELKLPVAKAPSPKSPHQPAVVQAVQAKTTEDALFLQAMSGVTRLGPGKTKIEPPRPAATREVVRTSDDALAEYDFQSLINQEGPFKVSETQDGIWGAAAGVNNALLAMLKKGEMPFRKDLDLHGQTREQARLSLSGFLQRCRREGERCVLVITGQGKNSPSGNAVLKEALPQWLITKPMGPWVLAFCTARPEHGGAGAFYVLLRR